MADMVSRDALAESIRSMASDVAELKAALSETSKRMEEVLERIAHIEAALKHIDDSGYSKRINKIETEIVELRTRQQTTRNVLYCGIGFIVAAATAVATFLAAF